MNSTTEVANHEVEAPMELPTMNSTTEVANHGIEAPTMTSTTEDVTHEREAPMELPTMTEDASEHGIEELPFHMRVKSVELSRMRELTGTQAMEVAWEQCWQEGVTPWDVQGVTPAVAELLRAKQLRDGKALVPGCGSGYDVVAMGSPTRSVIGLDISPTALHQAHLLAQNSPGHAAQFVEFRNANFFTFSPPFKFDLVFDYTFFCAIDPSLRPRWAHKMADLLAVDGELITLMFPLDDHEGGPPFAVSVDAYEKVLGSCGFRLVSCDSEIPSLKNRTGLEKLGRWERAVPKLDGSEVTNAGL